VSSRRTMILIAAVAIGLLAAFALINYVSGVEDRANEGAERVPVLVVREDIEKGTSGTAVIEQSFIAQDKIARSFLPATAITDIDQIVGKVAFNNFAANQILVEGMFVDPAISRVGFGELLEGSNVAISISVDTIGGVAGLLVPGDEVDIFATDGDGGASDDGGTTEEGVLLDPSARLVYHEARILAIGADLAPQPGDAPPGEGEEGEAAAEPSNGLITLDLPVEAAQLIATLHGNSSLVLALTGPDYTAKPIPRIDPNELDEFPGETDAESRYGRLTPYGADEAQ
jgi:pilus assembly protein CpaB